MSRACRRAGRLGILGSADLPVAGLPVSLAVVVLAAGKGTRLRSSLPKVLHLLAGRPLLLHVLASIEPLAPDRIVVVVGHEAERVAACLPPGSEWVEQREQHGTGHAVLQARDRLAGATDRVLVLYGDVPLIRTQTLLALLEQHQAAGQALLTLATNTATPPAGLGRIVRDAGGRFLRIVEERDATPEERAITETNSGIGVYDAAWLWESLPQLTRSRSGEIYLTDLVGRATDAGAAVATLRIADPDETLGINTRAELVTAEAAFYRRRLAEWSARGVTVRLPDTTAIDAGVDLEADIEIAPNCRLTGRTVVAAGSRIGAGTTLESTELGAGARVSGAWITGYRIGPGALIGPGAVLLASGEDKPERD